MAKAKHVLKGIRQGNMMADFDKDMKTLKKLIKGTRVFTPLGLASIAADVAIDQGFRAAARRIAEGGISPESVAEADRIFALKLEQDQEAGIRSNQ